MLGARQLHALSARCMHVACVARRGKAWPQRTTAVRVPAQPRPGTAAAPPGRPPDPPSPLTRRVQVGYPGGVFAPFVPGDLAELKVKEIKNGRLAMLAFAGCEWQWRARHPHRAHSTPAGCLWGPNGGGPWAPQRAGQVSQVSTVYSMAGMWRPRAMPCLTRRVLSVPCLHTVVMAAQITGKGPLGALSEHLADPFGTTIFSKAVVSHPRSCARHTLLRAVPPLMRRTAAQRAGRHQGLRLQACHSLYHCCYGQPHTCYWLLTPPPRVPPWLCRAGHPRPGGAAPLQDPRQCDLPGHHPAHPLLVPGLLALKRPPPGGAGLGQQPRRQPLGQPCCRRDCGWGPWPTCPLHRWPGLAWPGLA
jgi:hypothetical protein